MVSLPEKDDIYSLPFRFVWTDGGSDDDDLFDSGLVPANSKVPKLVAETGSGEESKPLPPNPPTCKASPLPPSLQVNFVECEESNGEEEEEEEEPPEREAALPGTPFAGTGFLEGVQHPGRLGATSPGKPKGAQPPANWEAPKWESFFRRPSEEPGASDPEGPLPCPDSDELPPSSPFNEDDLSDSTHISSQESSQSTHISEQGSSQGWDSQADTVFLSSQERRALEFSPSKGRTDKMAACLPHLLAGEKKTGLPFDRGASSAEPGEGKARPWGTAAAGGTEPEERAKPGGRPGLRPLSPDSLQAADSQGSSDFEVPPSPGAEIPNPQQLRPLYQKLAAGDHLS